MRAAIIHHFGSYEAIKISQIDPPLVPPDSVLIRVRAAGINPVDWKSVRGNLKGSFRSVFPFVPGWDVAGTIEAVGSSVTEYAVGDEVLGYARKDFMGEGTFCELASVPIRCITHKPPSLPWVQAAALPLAGLTAMQTIEAVELQGRDTVFINGGTGGVGSFAVQLASLQGTRVLATGSLHNHEYLSTLGAEPISRGEGLRELVQLLDHNGLDAIIDTVDAAIIPQLADLMKPSARDLGRIVSIVDRELALKYNGKYVFVRPNVEQLEHLANLASSNHLQVEIAQTFALHQLATAFEFSESGHVRGKLVVDMDL